MTQPASLPKTVVRALAVRETNGAWSRLTLELLGDAAILAKRLNGHVGAWTLGGAADKSSDCTELAAHGCDRVTHLQHERLASWSSETVAAALALSGAADCRVVFLPADPRGEEVAALLAEQLQTSWIPDVLDLAVTRTGVLEITAVEPNGKLTRAHRVEGGKPTIVTMRAGVPEARRDDKQRKLQIEQALPNLNAVPCLTTVHRTLPADPRTVDIADAQRVVAAGRGTGGPDGVRLVAGLAEELGAALAASRLAVDLGWAPPERQVGQTGKTVRPELYVACGISGASHHLAGMRESKHIVAINNEAAAPIHDVAHLSLASDLHVLIPLIRAAMQRRGN
jgi:electron transfer flavoprotein alpha subunit